MAKGFTNAVRHANHSLPPETTINIDLALWVDRLEIRIWDWGKPFNPAALEEPKPGTLQEGRVRLVSPAAFGRPSYL